MIASRTKFAHSLALSLLRVTPRIQTTSPFCCACTPALKGWRVTSATATQTTTYARLSPGLNRLGDWFFGDSRPPRGQSYGRRQGWGWWGSY